MGCRVVGAAMEGDEDEVVVTFFLDEGAFGGFDFGSFLTFFLALVFFQKKLSSTQV